MKGVKRKSDCPVNFGLEVFGDKWTLLIIRDIIFKNKNYFGDFIQSEEGIATNLLTDRLIKLEKEGIVYKEQDKNHKQKIVYKLSQKGIDLIPILIEIIMWSAKYDNNTTAEKNFIDAVKKDRKALIASIAKRIK